MKKEQQEGPIQSNSGGKNLQLATNNGQIVMGDVVYQSAKVRPRLAPIQPNPDLHISDEQKAALDTLRREWVELSGKLKASPVSHPLSWLRINKVAGATSYHLIRKETYEKVVAFVRQQMGILRNMKTAPRKDEDWRRSRIVAIKVRSQRQLGNADAYKPYIKKFGATSLTELSTDQLQRTYAYIMAKKPN